MVKWNHFQKDRPGKKTTDTFEDTATEDLKDDKGWECRFVATLMLTHFAQKLDIPENNWVIVSNMF